MVHPSEILRNDSETSRFSAPLDVLPSNPVDCGIAVLPCLNAKLERYAKPALFVICISILGLLQGCSISYFQSTSNIWMLQYNFSPTDLDWLIYAHEYFAGLLAIPVAYWGNKLHRISWFGALVIFHAIACFVIIVPELHHPLHLNSTVGAENYIFCSEHTARYAAIEKDLIALGIFYFHQLFVGLAKVAFITLGITYLDDNVNIKNSAACIALAIASREFGKQIGMYLSWITFSYVEMGIFAGPVWPVLSILIFILGVSIALFPHSLPSVILKNAVASILDLANGIEPAPNVTQRGDGVLIVLVRLFKNKLLMCNIVSLVVMYSAVVNFVLFQSYFFRSRFFMTNGADLSGYQDPWLSQIITNLLKQPFVAVCIVTSGLIIAKIRPQAKYLALWNILIALWLAIAVTCYIFLNCEKRVQTDFEDKISKPYCSSHCTFPSDVQFSPVCTEDGKKTYFSPLHAGCESVEILNSIKIYNNCSCGANVHQKIKTKATEGPCNSHKCTLFWGLAQVNSVINAGLFATTLITNLIINLRCVLSTDKAVALALAVTLIGVIPYIPMRILYGVVAESLCRYHGKDGACTLHSESLGIFIPLLTVILIIISGILSVFVLFFVKKLELYKDEVDRYSSGSNNEGSLHELENMRDDNESDLFGTSTPRNEDVEINACEDELNFTPQVAKQETNFERSPLLNSGGEGGRKEGNKIQTTIEKTDNTGNVPLESDF